MKRLFIISIIILITINLFSIQDVSPYLQENHYIPTDDMWDIVFTFEASAEAMPGIETNNENIYTTTWNNNIFSRYEMDGTYLEDFTIDNVAGVRDMAYDGTYFYGSAANMEIFIMDLVNETLIGIISVTCSGISGVRHIAYDPELDGSNGGFWVGNWQELGAITMDGAEIYSNLQNPGDLYGSAYDPWGNGGPFLWLFSQGGNDAVIHQFDIADQSLTGVSHDATDMPGYITGSIAGGLASTVLNTGQIVLIANIQQEPNLIGIYELGITVNPQAPGSPTDFTLTPDPSGALELLVSWTNPSVNVVGNPLTELDEVRLYRDGILIYTDTMPEIGQPFSYNDISVPVSEMYSYMVVCGNIYGFGIPISAETWVGEDVPAAVTDFILIYNPQTQTATLTWTNPTEGLHGGAFNEQILGYHLERSDGCVFEISGIQTEYIDNTIPGSDYYYYTIVPYNSVGDGGSAQSNIGGWWPYIFIFEDFSGEFPPTG